jgi:hypothetical protein
VLGFCVNMTVLPVVHLVTLLTFSFSFNQGSRLILNLRAAASGGLKPNPTYVISDVKFKQYVNPGSSESYVDTENTVLTIPPKDPIDFHVDLSH